MAMKKKAVAKKMSNGLTAAQKKLPPFIQAALKKKKK
jgi:hypothetical protein